jgi:hypothetical protein
MTGWRRRRTIAIWGLAAFCIAARGWAKTGMAGPIADQAAEAERLLDAGDDAGALDAFDSATDAFWAASPLQLRAAAFADWISGYLRYQPRGDTPFAAGETVTIYVEPVGYSIVANDDMFAIALVADLEIQTPGGLVLAEADNFTSLDWQGRAKNRGFYAAISLGLPELHPGDYLLLLTLRDPTSDKSATATLPFTLGE